MEHRTTYSFTLRKYGNGDFAEVSFCDTEEGEAITEYLNKGYEITQKYCNDVGGRVLP